MATNISKHNFSFYVDDPKVVLADFYYKTKLSTEYGDNSWDIYKTINEYKIKTANPPIDSYTFFTLAKYLVLIHDYEGAKDCFLKLALHSTWSADAYFALACIKLKLGENADYELHKAKELYQEKSSEYAKYPAAILNCKTSDYKIEKTINIRASKRKDQIAFQFGGGSYSLMEIDTIFSDIKDFLVRELRYRDMDKEEDGFLILDIAYIKPLPIVNSIFEFTDCYSHISNFTVVGFDYKLLEESIDSLQDKIFKGMNES
jgi:hypothetical protein